MAFSPDAKLMAFAVPSDDETPSRLLVFDIFAPTTKPLYPPSPSLTHSFSYTFAAGVIPYTLLWHDKLNQIVVGDRAGAVHVLYDPAVSLRGAVMVEGRTVRGEG